MKTGVFQYPESTYLTVANASGSTYSPGKMLIIGGMLAVAMASIPTGTSGTFATRGRFKLPKATNVAYAVGQRLGIDTSAQQVTVDTKAGQFVQVTAAALTADTTVECEIVQGRDTVVVNRVATATEDTNNIFTVDTGNTNFSLTTQGWGFVIQSTAGVTRLPTGAITCTSGVISLTDSAVAATDRIVGWYERVA